MISGEDGVVVDFNLGEQFNPFADSAHRNAIFFTGLGLSFTVVIKIDDALFKIIIVFIHLSIHKVAPFVFTKMI